MLYDSGVNSLLAVACGIGALMMFFGAACAVAGVHWYREEIPNWKLWFGPASGLITVGCLIIWKASGV